MSDTPYKKFISKPMSRKQFIAHIGATVFAVTGLAGILKSLSDLHTTKVSSGYGSSSYGGGNASTQSKSRINQSPSK